MKILYATFPMAFHTPGGGEIQLLEYRSELIKRGYTVDLFNPWEPNFSAYDIVHFFPAMVGQSHFVLS